MKIAIHDCKTNQRFERDATPTEVASMEAHFAEAEKKKEPSLEDRLIALEIAAGLRAKGN